MGRNSDSEDSDYRRSGRHTIKKRRSRSRSSGSDRGSSEGSHTHRKRKPKHSKRSRSPKSRRRSRSRSRDRKRRSRSSSRSRKPRSRSRSRRSTSRNRSRRSRSRSRQRRSRSNSRGRRSRSRSHDRKRSKRSRSYSGDRRHSSSSRLSGKNEDSKNRTEGDTPMSISGIPGFDLMTPLEQNEARMQLALRAADAAAERLKAQGVLDTLPVTQEESLSVQEQATRRKVIEDIEDDTFKQSHFKSTGNALPKKLTVKQEMELNHDSAMFGLTTNDVLAIGAGNISKSIIIKDDLSLLAPVFFEDESKKMARWIEKLSELRRQLDLNSTTK